MQQTLFYKTPISSSGQTLTFESQPFATGENAAVLVMLQVLAISGTSQVTVQMQTSGDGESYTDVGSPLVLGVTGFTQTAVVATSNPYQKFMRARVVLTPLDKMAVFSLFVNLLPST